MLVIIDADQAVRAESVKLDVSVFGGRSAAGNALDLRFSRRFTVTPAEGWPVELAVIPLDRDSGRLFQIEASAVDALGGEVTAVRARSGFVPNGTFVLRLRLEDACRGVVCNSRQTCRGGACREIPMISLTDLVRYDPDMGVADGGMPMPVTCATDEGCTDGNFCNGRERCLEGVCAPGDRIVCDDGVDCTRDVCRGGSCVGEPDDTACPDGPGRRCAGAMGCQYDLCTAATCSADPASCETAVCVGTMCMRTSTCAMGQACCGGACVAAGCDDGNDCTLDVCAPATVSDAEVCRHTARTAACSDGNTCTTADSCQTDGRCVGTPLVCNDGNPCTDDPVCVPGAGCVPVPNAAPCDDGDGCTPVDRCSAGACAGTGTCDDGVACTMDVCTAARTCTRTPSDALCPGGTCNPTTGCQFATCNVSTNCAPRDVCQTTACAGATCMRTEVMCASDLNPCTDEACNPTVGCRSTPNTAPCSDGNACTLTDACSGGVCVGSSLNPCTEFELCTDASCEPSTGVCRLVDVAGPCGPNDRCQANVCLGGTCVTNFAFCPAAVAPDCVRVTCDPAMGCREIPANEGGSCCDGLPEFGRCNSGRCEPLPGTNPVCSGPVT